MLAKGPEDPLVPQFGVLLNDVFTDIDDRDQIIAGYERWLRGVREKVDPDRLVEWKPGEGWEPICRALGLPVPNRHENSTATYVARQDERSRTDEARVASLPASGN